MAACTKHWRTDCDAVRAEAGAPLSAAAFSSPPERHFPLSLRLLTLVLFAAGPFLASAAAGQPQDGAAQARSSAEFVERRALDHFYSAEFQEAEAHYKKAIELQPDNPLYWNGLADTYLFELMLAAGRLDAQLYSSANEFLNPTVAPPDRAVVQAMWDALGRARNLAEKHARENANDAMAYYALAVSYSIESNYHLSITRKPMDALRPGGQARDAALRARHLDPKLSDANLILGAYEYAIGSVPAVLRWILMLGGHAGSRRHGVDLIQDAMMHGKRTPNAAVVLLAVIYSREKMFVYSREMFQYLQKLFPRNYFYELEIARTYQRENNLGGAIQVCRNVARKFEAHAAGYDRVDAMKLYFQIAALLEEHRRPDDAMDYYQKVVGRKPEGVLHARSYLRLAELYRSRQEPEKARAMYENARRLPFPEIQKQAAAGLRRM